MQRQTATAETRTALRAAPSLDGGSSLLDLSDVSFALVGNTAVLTGTVASAADRHMVVLAVALVPGIDAILDLLVVRS